MPTSSNGAARNGGTFSSNGISHDGGATYMRPQRRAIFFGAGRFRLAWLLIAIALVNSLGWTLLRWRFENSFTNTQITLDYNDTRSLADAYQIPQQALLEAFAKKGATGLAIYQQTVFSLRDLGRLSVTSREVAERVYPRASLAALPPGYRYVLTFTRDAAPLQQQVLRRLQAQGTKPLVAVPIAMGTGERDLLPQGIAVPASGQLLSNAPMGFDPQQLALAHRTGLNVVARLSNTLNMTLPRARALLDDARRAKAGVVLFSEDEVLGYDTILPFVAQAARERGLAFGLVEFSKQRGWEEFGKASDGQVVRVHSVTGDEAAKLQREALIDRYTRAVKERDIRLPYVRLIQQFKGEYEQQPGQDADGKPHPPQWKENALQQNLSLVGEIADELKVQAIPGAAFLRPALNLAPAHGFGLNVGGHFLEYPLCYLQPALGARGAKAALFLERFLSGLGVVGGVLLLLNLFFDLSRGSQNRWLLLGLALTAVLSLSGGMGARLLALGAGVPFSFIGVMWGGLPELWSRGRAGDGRPSAGEAFKLGFGALVRTTLITSIGGFLVIAFLNSWRYMSKADEFFGEKATLTVPILLVALAFAGEVFPHRVVAEGANAARQRGLSRFRGLVTRQFTLGIALTLALVAFGGFIYMARTGNDSGMEISPIELALRSLLEKVFITRPRTKELFLANPAMIFAAYFALRRQWLPALVAATVVGMGQSDVINTLCHIHTPLFYGLWRTLTGVVVGGLIGGIALWLWTRIEARAARPRRFAGATPEVPARETVLKSAGTG